jgi:hypothetical protein
VIAEIRKLMLRSAQESVSREKLSRRKPAIAAGKKQQTTTRQWSRWTAPKRVWDPGGFQQSWEAHEQELMNFS